MTCFRSLRLLALGAAAFLPACSTVVSGTSQLVAINTPGTPSATCHLTGGDNVNLTVNPPASVRLPKSRNNIKVACQTQDNQAGTAILKSTYSNLSIVEYPLGYPIDAISGAMWAYPKAFDLTLASKAQPS